MLDAFYHLRRASSTVHIPLSPIENKARIHAHLCFFGFLVALPIGILVARLLRTFTRR